MPFSETLNIIEALRPRKVYFEQTILADEVHFLLLHRSPAKVYEANLNFIEREMK